jgi:hypothetical protein
MGAYAAVQPATRRALCAGSDNACAQSVTEPGNINQTINQCLSGASNTTSSKLIDERRCVQCACSTGWPPGLATVRERLRMSSVRIHVHRSIVIGW